MIRKKVNEKELINTLMEIGLSLRETRTYLSLLTRNNFTASEVAKAAGITRHAAYELLNKMIRLGMCKELIGKVRKFQAIQPGIAIPGLFEHYTEDFNSQLKHRQSLFENLKPILEAMFEQSRDQKDPLNYFEILYDKNQIKTRFREIQKKAKHDMIGFIKPPYSLTPTENVDDDATFMRGIKGRLIYECEGNASDLAEYLKGIEGNKQLYAGMIRFAKSLPTKLMIFDNKISLLALSNPITGKPSLTTLIISHTDFATVLKGAFEYYWAQAMPYSDFITNPEKLT